MSPNEQPALDGVTDRAILTRRDRLLAAAVDAFAARGFQGASVREIAAAAGGKVALLFYHFRSKPELYLAAVEDQLEKLAAGLDAALAGISDARSRLRVFVEIYLSYFIDLEPGLAVTLRELHGLPEHIAMAIAVMHHDMVTARLEGILASGAENGTFRTLNARACTLAIVGILHIFIRTHDPRSSVHTTRADAIEQVLDYYAAGLLPNTSLRPRPRAE